MAGEGSDRSSSDNEDTSSSESGSQKSVVSRSAGAAAGALEAPPGTVSAASAPADASEPDPPSAKPSSSPGDTAVPQDSKSEEWDSMSEVSDSPDVGDVHLGSNSSVPLTREDAMLARVDALKSLLNAHPLVPRDPRNPMEPFTDVESGVRLPDIHCAFRGCMWCEDVTCANASTDVHFHWGTEWRLFKHLMKEHAEAFEPELQACGMHATPGRVPTNLPQHCPRKYHTAHSQWQCDLFMHVHSVYLAAVVGAREHASGRIR